VQIKALKMQVSKKIRNESPKHGLWRFPGAVHTQCWASKSMSLMGLLAPWLGSNVQVISLQYGETQSEIPS